MNIKEISISERKSDYLFEKLSDSKNFKFLMPDSLESFDSDENGFSFNLKSNPVIYVEFLEKIKNERISLKSSKKSNIKFQIDFLFKSSADKKTECHIIFNGDINPFLKMILENPLKKLINNFSTKIKTL